MKFKPMLAAGLLAFSAAGAFADDGMSGSWVQLAGGDYVSQFGSVAIGGSPLLGGDDLISFALPPVSGPFTFVFTLSSQNIVLSGAPASYVSANGVQTGITAINFGGVAFGTATGSGAPAFSVLLAGVAGGNASYSGELRITPVPEPETYALMLAGLAACGFLVRRRSV